MIKKEMPRKIIYSKKAVTFLEMLISVSVFVLLAAAVAVIFEYSLFSYRQTTQKNEAVQQVQVPIEWISRDIQDGYAIITEGSDYIALVDSSLNYVNYSWNSSSNKIFRKVCRDTSYMLAEGINNLSFRYFNITNNPLTTPINKILSLKTVEIDVTAKEGEKEFRLSTVARFDFKPGYQWAKTYGGGNNDFLYALQNTTDQGYIYGGNTTSFGSGGDFLAIKTDANADIVWAKAYGDTTEDTLSSLREVSTGYVFGGHTTSSRGLGSKDFLLINTTFDGNVSWARVYGSSQSDTLFSLIQDSNGDYVLGGVSSGAYAGTAQKALLIKTSVGGTVNSSWAYNNTTDVWLYSVIESDANDGYVFVGSFNNQGLAVKTQANGAIDWAKRYTNVQEFRSILPVSERGYYMLGGRSSTGFNVLVNITNTSGSPNWGKTYSDVFTGANSIYSIQQANVSNDSGFILGSFNSTSATDFLVIKTDASGNAAIGSPETWAKSYNCTGTVVDRLRTVKRISGGYLLGGFTTNSTSADQDFWVIKTDFGGNLICCNCSQDRTSSITVSSFTATASDAGIAFTDITGNPNFKNATFTSNITTTVANPNVEYICPSTVN